MFLLHQNEGLKCLAIIAIAIEKHRVKQRRGWHEKIAGTLLLRREVQIKQSRN